MKTNKSGLLLLFIILVVFLLAVDKANAFPYSQINILDNITQTSGAYSYSSVSYTITMHNLSTSSFNISLPADITNLTALGGAKIIKYPSYDCQVFSTSNSCILVNIENITNNTPITLNYNYYQNYTSTNNSFNSTIYFLPSSFTSSLTIRMLLPESAYVPDNAYYAPGVESIIFSLPNKRFNVTWGLINQTFSNSAKEYVELPFTIQYNLQIKKTSSQNNLDTILTYLVTSIIILILLIVAYFFYKRRKKNGNNSHKMKNPKTRNKNLRLMVDILNSDEKLVLNSINKIGFTKQSEIIKKTTFSKVKISKILSKLLRYHLIKIKQEGRENKIKRV